jgi:uncharacterized metal-binding protein
MVVVEGLQPWGVLAFIWLPFHTITLIWFYWRRRQFPIHGRYYKNILSSMPLLVSFNNSSMLLVMVAIGIRG